MNYKSSEEKKPENFQHNLVIPNRKPKTRFRFS